MSCPACTRLARDEALVDSAIGERQEILLAALDPVLREAVEVERPQKEEMANDEPVLNALVGSDSSLDARGMAWDGQSPAEGSSPVWSIPSISRGDANNQSVRYEPRPIQPIGAGSPSESLRSASWVAASPGGYAADDRTREQTRRPHESQCHLSPTPGIETSGRDAATNAGWFSSQPGITHSDLIRAGTVIRELC
jgi:hypothetical protein